MQRLSNNRSYFKPVGLMLICFLMTQSLWAHTVVRELENLSGTDAAFLYLKLGYEHILPLGLDHILFVLSLFLLSPKLKPVLWQATAFTVAHSVTLGLAMYKLITPSPAIIEPMIALSIMYVALENIISPRLKTSRIGIVFLFGLVHGMGFASALGELGLPQNAYLSSLVMFNVGVELGQITVILAAFFLFGKWFGQKPYYRKAIVIPLSVLITLIAAYWSIERLSFISQDKKMIVDTTYVDSLISNYTKPAAQRINEEDLQFWKKRIDPKNPGISNELKYASMLVMRFNLLGDINDVLMADSVLKKIDADYGHKEAAPQMALSKQAILQHRFKAADSLLSIAKKTGIKPYESVSASFDVDFEQGRMLLARTGLKQMASANDYGYNFRYAKLAHYNGDIDSSIKAMKKAVILAGNDNYLKNAALSNLADLYLHDGDLQKAYNAYKHSIALNSADLHSIMGMAWIALINDKNDSIAERLFLFVHSKTKSPDPVFKLVQTYMARGDSISAMRYAKEFEQQVTQTAYGNMYNKYLVELYTGILNEPAKAEAIALKELDNRTTPQTYAWYAWALFSNNKPGEAYEVYRKHVSGKPLEGLELYWMGKLMQGSKKENTAGQFFKEAWKNRYDLSTVYIEDIKSAMEK